MQIIANPDQFLQDSPFKEFLGISYEDPQAFELARSQLRGRSFPRSELTAILGDYNRGIGNDGLAMQQIERLASSETQCVVTGQQLGFMGGPSYTILKGISCLSAAKAANAVPIFWLATEDHDIAEIDHTYLLDPLGNLQRFHLGFPHDGRCVEDLKMSPKNNDVLQRFFQTLGLAPLELSKENFSYSTLMASLLVQLFAGTGMVFLEPRLLRPLSIAFFKREVEERDRIQDVLKETTMRLELSGGSAILRVGEGTNLFFKQPPEGFRRKLLSNGDGLIVGMTHYKQQEILALIENHPEYFSTNAAARAVLQNLLLPTVAYIAGPTEMAYHCQLRDYHHFHGIEMPCLIPRLSASFIPPFAADLLEKCGLQPWHRIPQHWPDLMPSLRKGEEGIEAEWFHSTVTHFEKEIPCDMLARYVKQAARKLMHKISRRRLRQKGLPGYGLHFLRNLLHPHDKLQERVLNWWNFQAYSHENLIVESLKHLSWKPEGHQYIYFS